MKMMVWVTENGRKQNRKFSVCEVCKKYEICNTTARRLIDRGTVFETNKGKKIQLDEVIQQEDPFLEEWENVCEMFRRVARKRNVCGAI